MAVLAGMKFEDDEIRATLRITKEEYDILKNHISDILVIPAGPKAFENTVSVGKLGNSIRLFLPRKVLRRYNFFPEGKTPVKILKIDNKFFLLAHLKSGKDAKRAVNSR